MVTERGALDEVGVDEGLVRRLLAEQHPDLADRSLVFVGEGWDNRVYRLGDDLTVRLPTRPQAAPLVDHELIWLPDLVADLPGVADGGLATSVPVRGGEPGCGYPWRWSIGPWLPGAALAEAPVDDQVDAARRLSRFLAAFHRPAPSDAPANPYRGVPLVERLTILQDHLGRLATLGRPLPGGVSAAAIVDRVVELAAVPPWSGPPVWLHGDPHALNLVVDGGRLTGLIDFGDLTSGDPASDLVARWMVFDEPLAREAFVSGFDLDDDTWRRAEGWALALAVAYRAGSPAGSPLLPIGERVLVELAPSA